MNNPYDTERSPMGSSSGSGTAVAANLVTAAIAEESGTSIRGPAVYNNLVGIAATQELVSRHGTKIGPKVDPADAVMPVGAFKTVIATPVSAEPVAGAVLAPAQAGLHVTHAGRFGLAANHR